MNPSKIEWTEATWSPVIGCTKVSAGCKHCYAEREAETRWSKNPKSIWYGRRFTDVLCRPEAIAGAGSPLRWRKPRRIFVCPRGDLFHPDVPAKFVADVFGVMAACPQHTFQVLTKRPQRMLGLLYPAGDDPCFPEAVEECMALYSEAPLVWPLPNVWIGVSVEDQATADERIPLLLHTPAAVRWVSAEPLLGPVDLSRWACDAGSVPGPGGIGGKMCPHCMGSEMRPSLHLDWVVAGGESGPQARPMHPDWVRCLRDQCAAAGVPFLFKQWGEYDLSYDRDRDDPDFRRCGEMDRKPGRWINITGGHGFHGGRVHYARNVGKRAAGRLLDGVLHDAYPEVRS